MKTRIFPVRHEATVTRHPDEKRNAGPVDADLGVT